MQQWEQDLIAAQRIAHLATIGEHGQPSVLPVVYAYDGLRFFIPLDGKPKRVGVGQLRRVRDILANPQVALVIDAYSEDWSQLAWLQIRGTALLLADGEVYEQALELLTARYLQYTAMPLRGQPLIAITPIEQRSWQARPAD